MDWGWLREVSCDFQKVRRLSEIFFEILENKVDDVKNFFEIPEIFFEIFENFQNFYLGILNKIGEETQIT